MQSLVTKHDVSVHVAVIPPFESIALTNNGKIEDGLNPILIDLRDTRRGKRLRISFS